MKIPIEPGIQMLYNLSAQAELVGLGIISGDSESNNQKKHKYSADKKVL
jgi:hypothetical protein